MVRYLNISKIILCYYHTFDAPPPVEIQRTGFSEQTKFQILWLSTEEIEINLMVSVD